jgi:DNA-binding transcriptional regulator YdaS (Cro superfamily)
MATKKKNFAFICACDFFGSGAALARALGVTRGAVSHVATGYRAMPPSWAPKIERLTGGKFKVQDLLPDSEWAELLDAKERSAGSKD